MPIDSDLDYDLTRTVAAIRRYWWVVLVAPALILSILSVRNLTADYQSTFRASVLLPGDTEIPGSAERPELMILDDLAPVVESQAFAEMVADQASLEPGQVTGTLSASRYSRIATVTVKESDRDRARTIADAASAVFPQAVNQLMVAEGAQQATVRIIDAPAEPIRGDENAWTVTAIATVVGLGMGLFAALVLDALTNVRRTGEPA